MLWDNYFKIIKLKIYVVLKYVIMYHHTKKKLTQKETWLCFPWIPWGSWNWNNACYNLWKKKQRLDDKNIPCWRIKSTSRPPLTSLFSDRSYEWARYRRIGGLPWSTCHHVFHIAWEQKTSETKHFLIGSW